MQFLAPDVLEQARGLSAALCWSAMGLGLLLWVTGWWAHRFWVVLATTVLAGVFGLLSPVGGQVPPLVMGLLLAVAAGILALAMVRVLAFAAGGAAAWVAVHALAPPAWHEPLICLLAGGLVGLLLFRVWIMGLTSLGGTLLMAYGGLSLADGMGKLNAVALARERGPLLDATVGAVALAGLLLQFVMERRRRRWEATERARILKEDELSQLYQPMPRPWWGWGVRNHRRAG